MNDLTWIEIIYWASTIVGGTLLVLRSIMLLVGGIEHNIIDTALDAGHMDISGDHHQDSDGSFKLISMQGLTSFFMMFGLVGLALLKADVHVVFTVFGGAVAGLATVGIVGWLFTQMKRLQSEGTIDIQNTLNTDGSVYLTIPRNGSGQVQIIVQGSLKILDAVSSDESPIPTGDKVRVISVKGGNTLVVEKIK